jgi:hypothetical protein
MAEQGIPAQLAPTQPFMGQQQPLQEYPVPMTPAGSPSSGGLVNVAGQIRQNRMDNQNMANQQQQMQRAQTSFGEQQTASKAAGNVGTPGDAAGDASGGGSGGGFMQFLTPIMRFMHVAGGGNAPPSGAPAGGALDGTTAAGPSAGAIPAAAAPVAGDAAAAAAPVAGEAAGAVGAGAAGAAGAAAGGAAAGGAAAGTAAAGAGAAGGAGALAGLAAFLQEGGGVPDGSPGPLRFMQGPTTGDPGPHSTILAFQEGGAVPAYGVEAGGTEGLRGFAEGGAIPQEGPPSPAAAPEMQGPPAPTSPADAHAKMVSEIVGLHQDLHNMTLNEQDEPNSGKGAVPVEVITQAEGNNRARSGGFLANGQSAPPAAVVDTQAPTAPPGSSSATQAAYNQAGSQTGAPPAPSATGGADAQTPATQAAVRNVAQSAQAQAGDPGPAAKHSITSEQWDAHQQRIDYAVKMAAYAGRDPGQVRAALNANTNAWVQGGVLKYLATANAAMLSNAPNKDDLVQRAMHNAYYYMPDGNELQFDKKGPNGQLQYQDPINPWLDAKTRAPVAAGSPGAEANMIPVDAAHIQQLGTAMLDPMKVQNMIQETRMAQSQMALQGARGRAAEAVGRGRELTGLAANTRANTGAALEPSEETKNRAIAYHNVKTADAYAARALQQKVPNIDPTVAKEGAGAGSDFEQAVQGQLSNVPLTVPDPRPGNAGKTIPNPDPNAGKSTRDPTKSLLPNATPQEVASGKGLAGNIYIANNGAISRGEAVRLAALGVAGMRKGATHPEGGKPVQNFHMSPDGVVHIWNPATNRYEVTKIPTATAGTAQASSGNFSIEPPPPASGAGGIPTTAEAAPPETEEENSVLSGNKDQEG